MHQAAKAIAARYNSKVREWNLVDEFHGTFFYDSVYYSYFKGQPCTIEKFVAGEFSKLINNTGTPKVVDDDEREMLAKAESLCHFSLSDSEEKMILVDIQGFSFNLVDPEIATAQILGEDDEVQFCAGNLGQTTINNFKELHSCSKFCALLGLNDY